MMRRLKGMTTRCVITLVNDALKMQTVQVKALAAMPLDGLENFQPYGFTANALPGAEALVLSVGADLGNAVVICVADRRYRLTGLQSGEVAIYDNQGQSVVLKQDHIAITSPNKVVVSAPTVQVNSANVSLGGEGGQPIARVGDSVNPVTWKIVSGSSSVTSI
jgi:phage baseplate assembly protein V